MAIASTVQIVMNGRLGGEACQTHFHWFAETEYPAIDGFWITDAFYNDVWSVLKPLVCDEFLLESLAGWYSDFTIGKQPTHLATVNEGGTNLVSDPMPGFNTVVVNKYPDNTTIYPVGQTPFQNGFTGFSGFPEVDQTNGLLTAQALTDWGAMTQALLDFVVMEGGITARNYRWGMYRHSKIVAERAYVMLLGAFVSQKVGTRVSRKRRY